MRKIYLLVLSAQFIFSFSFAQQYEWAFNLGGDNEEITLAVTADANSNVFATGSFTDSTDLDPSGNVHMVYGDGNDIFLAKYDTSGNYLWGFALGTGTINTIEKSQSLVCDNQGNVYVCGSIGGFVDADPGVGVSTLSAGGIQTAFVAKYSAAGNFLWAFSIPSTSNTNFNNVKLDGQGNIYVAGRLEGTADLDPGSGTTNLTSYDYTDALIAKYDANGNFLWAFNLGGGGLSDGAYDITVDGNNNVYIGGAITNLTDVDPGIGVAQINTSNTQVPFLGKYKSNGDYVWGIVMVPGDANDWIVSLTADTLGNIYAAGNFFGTADFDPSANTNNLTSTYAATFFAKYDTSGNFIWAHSIEGGPSGVVPTRIDYNKKYGWVYLTGHMDGNVDFDPSANNYIVNTHGGYFDAFVAQYTMAGNIGWAFSIGVDSLFSEVTRSIKVLDNGDFYIGGQFGCDTADFNPYPGVNNLTSGGVVDAFVAKYYLDPTGSIPLTVKNNSVESFKIFPNPATDQLFIKSDHENFSVSVNDLTGRKLMKEENKFSNQMLINVSSLQNGIYFIQISNEKESVIRKFVKE